MSPGLPSDRADGAIPLPVRREEEFEFGAELGRGTYGVVERARERATGAEVAIKTLQAATGIAEAAAAYFGREATIAARLDHPRLAAFRGVGEGLRGPFLVMDLVPGRDLARHVVERGVLSEPDAARMARHLLAALAHAHERGFVHRDVKPPNVMVDDGAEGLEARLLDFGLARAYVECGLPSFTATGEVKGTLLFAAPECIHDAKRAQPTADLFSLGATLHVALSGKPPYEEARLARDPLSAILEGAIVPLRTRRPDLSPAFCAVVDRALRMNPAHRWPTAAAMSAAMPAS